MTCDSDCEPPAWLRALHPGGTDQFGFDFEADLTRYLERRTSYSSGTRLRSRLVGGYEWEVTTAGQTGLSEPRLPTTLAATVTDGSVVLTCRAISTASLEATVSAVAWDAPTGITVSSESISDQRAVATLSADADLADGEYEVVITATAGAKTIPVTCILKVNRC